MIIYSAERLELRVVYILDANGDVAPHHKAVLGSDAEEEHRVFCVTMTRTRGRFHIYHVKERYRKEQVKSRFVEEAEE